MLSNELDHYSFEKEHHKEADMMECTDNQFREMSTQEIEKVSGAVAPLLLAAALVGGFVAGAAFAYAHYER